MRFSKKWGIKRSIAALMLLMVTGTVGAQYLAEDEDLENRKVPGITLHHSGLGSYEFGQIMEGQYARAPAPHAGELNRFWMQRAFLRMGIEAQNSKGLSMILAGEGMLYFPYSLSDSGSGGSDPSYLPRMSWYIHHAEAKISLGDSAKPYLRIGMGFFPFKYNSDAHNFGDYLFRVSTYPQYMPTTFDVPYQRLLGLHLNSTLFDAFKQDLLLTTEMYLWPRKDFSLTYMVDYTVARFVEVGAGIMGHRLISVDKSLTTPKGTTAHKFSFAGAKFMGKLSFNFQQFIPSDVFGENDLRLYSEICLNGLKDYPVKDSLDGLYPGYDDLSKRLMLLLGFNWPTHPLMSTALIPGTFAFIYNQNKFNRPTLISAGAGIVAGLGLWFLERQTAQFLRLDVLSIETEYWNSDFANSYEGVYLNGTTRYPYPVKYKNSGHFKKYGGPWHWSVQARKRVLENLSFKAQVARDHTVIETSQTGPSTGGQQESMDGRGDWSWMFKIEFGF